MKTPRARMVGWYDPRQLLQTAGEVVASTILGRHADARLMEVFGPPIQGPTEDYAKDAPPGDFWFDFVADTGDGWNSTYAVASSIATEHSFDGVKLPRGRVLVFGGDEVYPVASRDVYEEKLENPYRIAFRGLSPRPEVFAIPGNHDWYDSLVSFTRLFCQQRNFAGCETKQKRSYFALKLPRGWWLIGTDVQLASDIDQPQLDYFRDLVRQGTIGAHDRIILCNAEPHWIYERKYGDKDGAYRKSNLRYLENVVFEDRIALSLSGDLHHYVRHSAPGHHKIVAGGGGAFLHPTHDAWKKLTKLAGGFERALAYPGRWRSFLLTFGNLLFPFKNPLFGAVSASLYLVSAWSAGWWVLGGQVASDDRRSTVGRALDLALVSSTSGMWIALVVAGAILLTDSHSKLWRVVGGLAHAAAHGSCIALCAWVASSTSLAQVAPGRHAVALTALLVFVFGWVTGSLVMGIYLLVALNVFGRHSNEAFSSLAIPDFKNHLRLKIDPQGGLTVHAIGIDRVPRRWTESPIGPWTPRGGTPPRLIDRLVIEP